MSSTGSTPNEPGSLLTTVSSDFENNTGSATRFEKATPGAICVSTEATIPHFLKEVRHGSHQGHREGSGVARGN